MTQIPIIMSLRDLLKKILNIPVFFVYSTARAKDWYLKRGRLPGIKELPILLRRALYEWSLSGGVSSPGSNLEFKTPKRLDPYETWLDVNKWNSKKVAFLRKRLEKVKTPPLLSVIMPVYNTPPNFLELAIRSVVEQVYENWELCIADDASSDNRVHQVLNKWTEKDPRIKILYRETNGDISVATNAAASMAEAEYLVFLDHDDELSPDALGEIALYVTQNPHTDLLYSDDDKIGINGKRFAPQFKPDWSPELLLSYMYFSHAFVIRRRLFEEIGGARVGFEGSQDYDIALRASEKARHVGHIPLVLYHWRVLPNSTASSGGAKPKSFEAGRKAVQEALDRRGISAEAHQPDWALKAGVGIFSHRFTGSNCPSVTIIIPTKNQTAILRRCVDSIFKNTEYTNYEILIIDNDSDDPETTAYFEEIVAHPIVKVVRISNPGGKFNYAYINNRAAETASSEYILFLNNDTEILSKDWLSQMTGYGKIEGVGAVGARLLYPDKKIQHAGIIIKFYYGMAGHAFKGLPEWDSGYLSYSKVSKNYSAVTAACLLTPRKLFFEIGGFDEVNFKIAYNDVDYCGRLIEKGYRIVYTPDAELTHHEGFSRGFIDDPIENVNFRKKYYSRKDKYYNPSLSFESEYFEVQPRCVFLGDLGRSIKTFICTHNLNHEGAPYSQYELTVGLKQKGLIAPTVLSPVDGPLRGLYESHGIEVIINEHLSLVWESARFKEKIKQLSTYFKEAGAELVYGNTLINFCAIAAAKEAGLPSIWNIRESESWQYYINWWGKEVAAEAMKCFEHPYKVIFVARATKSIYTTFNTKHNFMVIYNGLNLNRLYAEGDKYERKAVRDELGVTDNDLMILLPGTVCERKGQHDLVLALQKINADCRQRVKCFIVGDQPNSYSKKLHELVEGLPVELRQRVLILPTTPGIVKYYKAADIFVCTSRIESFPRIVLEAMAFHIPIITTPVFGIREQVQEGINAIFFDPGDIGALAKAIEDLVTNSEKRKGFSENSKYVLQQLETFEEMVDAYGRVFQEAYLSK